MGYDDLNGYSDMGVKGYSSLTPNIAMYANLDPRAQQLAINTIDQFYQDGGALPIVSLDGRTPAQAYARPFQSNGKPKIVIGVKLGIGSARAKVWTCDLTKEYVAINGDYRS